MGKEGQTIPDMSHEWIRSISDRYIELYEKVIGEKFIPSILDDVETEKCILNSLKKLQHPV